VHQHIEHYDILVHRAPRQVLLAVDRDDDFIEIPLIAPRQGAGQDGRARSSPNFTAQRRAVSYVRPMPRVASDS
jgi:hypothetical protein